MYACFLEMIAQVTNLKPGTINYSIKDAHVYVNQLDGVKEQLRREDRYNELSKLDREELLKLRDNAEEKRDSFDNNHKIIVFTVSDGV